MKNGYLKYLFIFYLLLLLDVNGQRNIFVNQLGYLPNSTKIVVCNTKSDSFYILNESSGKIILRKAFEKEYLNDELSGMDLKKGDFSELNQPGRFKIKDQFGNESYSFSIGKNVFTELFKAVEKFYYFQRCGTALLMKYAGKYYRLACHQTDAFYHQSTNKEGLKYVVGGWHDAGDFGKYVVNATPTVGTMLLAYQLFPDYFSSDSTGIPESGNGVPDLLDEVKYEIKWEMEMQDSSGGVFTKVTPKNFAPFVMPNQDNSKRFVYRISTAATAGVCAVTAKAAQIYSGFDADFANKCKNVALLAWKFLQKNPDILPPGGFKNPADTFTGEYGDSNDKDERLWASIELFGATKDSVFLDYYLKNFNSAGLFSRISFTNVSSLAHIAYLYQFNSKPDLTTSILLGSLNKFVQYVKSTINGNGFGISLKKWEFYWGSNSLVLNDALLLIVGDYFNSQNNSFEYVVRLSDYIFGLNPLSKSFVSGFGTNKLMHPHHRQSESDGVTDPIPGMLAGGPNEYLNDNTLKSLFNSATPPALCYVDTVNSYASNEVAINWNAPLVFVAGYLNGRGVLTKVNDYGKIKLNLIPEKIKLLQNYPNPLSGSKAAVTNLKFQTLVTGDVKVDFYNLLGEKIKRVNLGRRLPGNYSLRFNIRSLNLPSGVYFFILRVNDYFDTKKMVYLK